MVYPSLQSFIAPVPHSKHFLLPFHL